MKKAKRLASILTLVLVLAILSGCGSATTTMTDHTGEYYQEYLSQDFPFPIYETVFREYNPYYAGYFRDVNGSTLYVVTDSPQELFTLLAENSVAYETVRYSYNDLFVLSNLIPSLAGSVLSSLVINVPENRVDIGISCDESETPASLKGYVDSGIVVIQDHVVYYYD